MKKIWIVMQGFEFVGAFSSKELAEKQKNFLDEKKLDGYEVEIFEDVLDPPLD